VLDDLARRGWTHPAPQPDSALLTLTDTGRAAHAEAATRIATTRSTVLGDLTGEQYEQTVHNLSVMAANVEADLATRRA
jgi:hypothetical protein